MFPIIWGFGYTGPLAKENCFGWRLADDKRVIGESSGGFYGVNSTSSGTGKKDFQMIGFIHAETDLSIGGKPVKARPEISSSCETASERGRDD